MRGLGSGGLRRGKGKLVRKGSSERSGWYRRRGACGAAGDTGNTALWRHMSETGIARLGRPGALDEVVRFALEDLGLALKQSVHSRLTGGLEGGRTG